MNGELKQMQLHLNSGNKQTSGDLQTTKTSDFNERNLNEETEVYQESGILRQETKGSEKTGDDHYTWLN